MIKLKKNEKLVQAGTVELRAPDGSPLPAVPQYIIVAADEADSAAREVQENERVLYGGLILNDKKRAEERFAALKAGRDAPPREIGTPLYFIEGAENVNPKTGRTAEGDKIIGILSKEFAEIFAIEKRKEKALAKQGATEVLHGD